MVGKTLGHYEILEPLGAGGMGEVYRARDTTLDRDVAIKVLPEDFANDQDRLARFEREAKTVASLNHPNIVVIHSVERDGTTDFITMELVSGANLADRIRAGRLQLDELLDIAIGLAEAVAAAHKNGITHRDLKPSNVMITDEGRVKVLDFGLAKPGKAAGDTAFDSDPASEDAAEQTSLETEAGPLTEDGRILGTVAYMAPEQADGRGADGRSDIFAVGIILYEMATGQRPFKGDTRLSLLSSIVTETPPAISELSPRSPPGLERIVHRCLEKKPDDRYQSAVDLRNDLRELAGATSDQSGSVDRSVGAIRPVARPVWIAVATLAIVAVIAGYQFMGPDAFVPIAGTVAVMPFENLGDPADERQFAGMMTFLVRDHLAQTEPLTVVSGYRLYDIHRQISGGADVFDRSLAGEIAREAGAAIMVLGQINTVGEETVVFAELIDVATLNLLAQPRVTGGGEDVVAMALSMASELRSHLLPSGAEAAALVAAGGGTDIVEALRAYNRGEALLRVNEVKAAIAQFATAVNHDPGFHRPWYQLGFWGLWTDDAELIQRQAIDRLPELIDKFPADERPAVQALLRYAAGDLVGSAQLYEDYLLEHPDDKYARYVLGEVYAHSARDYDMARSSELFESALELDPSFSLAFMDIPYNYVAAGNLARARETITEWEDVHRSFTQPARAFLAAFEGDFDAGLGRAPEAEEAFEREQLLPIYALLGSRWELAEQIIEPAAEKSSVKAFTLRHRGDLSVYRGQFPLAAAAYEEAGRVWEHQPHGGIIQGGGPASSLRALAELLALQGNIGGARDAADLALTIQPESPRRLYFAGRFSLLAGDAAAAEAHFQAIVDLLPVMHGEAGWIYRDALQAEILIHNQQPAAAIPLLEHVLDSNVLLEDFFVDYSTGALAFRDALATAHEALGEKRQAVAALEALLEATFERLNHPVPNILAYYRLGILHGELGNAEESERYLRSFLDYWGAAGWNLDEVADARAKLPEVGGS